jgi:hypothetical protein
MSDLSIGRTRRSSGVPLAGVTRCGDVVRFLAYLLLRVADSLDLWRERRRRAGPPVSRLSAHLLRDIGFLPDQIARKRRLVTLLP